jgi:hypothetical protein
LPCSTLLLFFAPGKGMRVGFASPVCCTNDISV